MLASFLWLIATGILSNSTFNSACCYAGSGISSLVTVIFFGTMTELNIPYFDNSMKVELGTHGIVNICYAVVV